MYSTMEWISVSPVSCNLVTLQSKVQRRLAAPSSTFAFCFPQAISRTQCWDGLTIRSTEAKENHSLRFARILGIQSMREQCFLTAAAQNSKRLVKLSFSTFRVLRSTHWTTNR